MAFRPPVFNLLCDIYRYDSFLITHVPDQVNVPCQWRGVAKPANFSSPDLVGSFSIFTEILFPIGTDIRGSFDVAGFQHDFITLHTLVPPPALPDPPAAAGPDLPFQVFDVYDIGRGFTNEYRVAVCYKYPPWPTPIPYGGS